MSAQVVLLISLALLLFTAPVEGRYITPGVRYVLMDTTHPSYAGIIAAARARHQVIAPGNIMSIVLSIDGTEALVKMIGITAPFEASQFNKPAVLNIFTRETHDQVIDMFTNDERWKR